MIARKNRLFAAASAIGVGALLAVVACVGDAPKLPDTQCDGTDTFCSGACTNTQTDARNCGSCGKVCDIAKGETCQKGTCGPPCTGGTTRCGTACLDVQNDPKNCGDCNKKCADGEVCSAGKCALVCNGGLTSCPRAAAPAPDAGAPVDSGATEAGATDAGTTSDASAGNPSANVCVNLQSDPNNCGMCGNVCPPDKSACDQGKCKVGDFPGILTNLAQDDLSSRWQECHADLYNATTSLATVLQNKCTQAKLLLGCRAVGQKTLITAAEAPRADVTFDVGTGPQASHIANGTAWYYNASTSWGYAMPDDLLQRSSCDVAAGQYPDRRLCWHTSGGNMYGGYRCGSNSGLNVSTAFERVVFQSP